MLGRSNAPRDTPRSTTQTEITMTDTANITVVRRFYGNLGSPEILTQVLSPTIRWEIVPGFPYGGVYVGVDAVFRDFFGRVLQDFEEWRTEATEIFGAGDRVFALGTYSGRAKVTGKTFTARFVHAWTLDGEVMVRLQQCADTVQLARALEG
jgi:ketosteroid isomerase-like protein